MEKNIIGDWGSDLSDSDYGKALAALGILEASGTQRYSPSSDPQDIYTALREEISDGGQTAIWRQARNIYGRAKTSLSRPIYEDAEVLARGWDLFFPEDHPRKRPRLAIESGWIHRPDLVDFDSLIEWLTAKETKNQAVVLIPETGKTADCRVAWHWPVQVGIPAGSDGEALFATIQSLATEWAGRLSLPALVGEGRDTCDLLILPPGMADKLMAQPQLRLRASFIVCLDQPVAWSQAPETIQANLMLKMGASGVAMVGNPDYIPSWYREMIRELSHDQPIHAALWVAGIYDLGITPTILGYPQALDKLRILSVAEQIDRQVAFTQRSKGTPGKKDLGTRVLEREFSSETVDGERIAAEIAEEEKQLEDNRPPRWIQANLWREASEAKPVSFLAPEQPSLLTIHIGPSAEIIEAVPFPDSQIDFDGGAAKVDIQIMLAGAAAAALGKKHKFSDYLKYYPHVASFPNLKEVLEQPKKSHGKKSLISTASDRISLPPAGDSEFAEFAVWPLPGTKKVTGRIFVTHRNRVIQTARLTASVSAEAKPKGGLTVIAESVIHSQADDLEERRDFDAALATTNDIGKRSNLIISVDGILYPVDLDALQNPIANIRSVVASVAHRPKDTLDLFNNTDMRDAMISLVYHGSLLYNHLHKQLGVALEKLDRIQLITCGSTFFPLEYVYDGPGLDTNAEVCPNAANALKKGDCGSCEHQASDLHICPLQFWGFKKVIERHAAIQRGINSSSTGRGARQKVPSPTRIPFGLNYPVIFAASDKAFEYKDGAKERGQLIASLSDLGSGSPPREAQNWAQWRVLVGDSKSEPKVLVLIPHSDTIKIAVDVLEIGTDNRISKANINPTLIGSNQIPKLLLLLGCSTAEVTEAFAPYPELFHDAGADIIIATLAPILGADAVPIAQWMAERLATLAAGGKKIAFGEVLRDTRRELLGQGHPGVLGLVSFGDADWLFGG